jgi:hypothetical protein
MIVLIGIFLLSVLIARYNRMHPQCSGSVRLDRPVKR